MNKIIKHILIILILGLSITFTMAKTPTQCERTKENNYGVNKHWQITNNNLPNVQDTFCVDASEKIYDFSGVLTDEEYDQLKKEIDTYISQTKMDLVIVTYSLPYTYDKQNEDFAADFYDYNDFGIDFEKYSGTLLFRNTYEEDPYYDIYTFGNAQLYYDYDRLQIILDGIYDDLHEQRYLDGFSEYIRYLNKYYNSGYGLRGYEVDKDGYLQKKYEYPFVMIFIISSVITLIVMLILVKKNKMVAKATTAEAYLDSSKINITNVVDQFVSTRTTHYTTSSSSGGGGGGGSHHSSSGSSGGGHSSGGGRHG